MRFVPAIFIVMMASFQAASFAAQPSPLAALDDAEKTYYEKVFTYTMEVTKSGENYEWASYSGKGSIQVEKAFVSKSGASCRNFTENFDVKGQTGKGGGIGCKRVGGEGWCKLKADNALTCALEQPANLFSDFTFSLDSVSAPSAPNVTMPGVNTNVNVSAPNVNAPDMPHMEAPKKENATANIAEKVTSGAGEAAGSAASGGLKWFTHTFR